MKIAHVSTFPDLQCGIASYAADLIDALPAFTHRKYVLHYGANETADSCDDATNHSVDELRRLASSISSSDCDVVSLQHEFGIWGGPNGENVLAFLDHLKKPLVTTLHTTLGESPRPSPGVDILRRIAAQSRAVLVLTARARDALRALDIPMDAVAVVPHGVPDIAFVAPPATASDAQAWQLCSVGFIRPGKGLEVAVRAISMVVAQGFRVRYIIAGATQSQFRCQEAFLSDLAGLADALDLSGCVSIRPGYLSRAELIRLIQGSHAGLFAYQSRAQASSGTLPLIMSAGRPIVATPFGCALAKQAEVGGVTIASGFSEEPIAEALTGFFSSDALHPAQCKALHERTRSWLWPTVAAAYASVFGRLCA